MLSEKKKKTPYSDPPTPNRISKLRMKFEFPRGDFFLHCLSVGDVMLNLINNRLFLSIRDLTRLQSSE